VQLEQFHVRRQEMCSANKNSVFELGESQRRQRHGRTERRVRTIDCPAGHGRA
jgi:hypothetical protein